MTARIEDGGPAEAGLVERLLSHVADIERYGFVNAERADLEEAAAEITRLRAENAGMLEALRECQSALAMVIAPDAIKQTTALNAFAAATAAEASARAALSNATTPETGGGE